MHSTIIKGTMALSNTTISQRFTIAPNNIFFSTAIREDGYSFDKRKARKFCRTHSSGVSSTQTFLTGSKISFIPFFCRCFSGWSGNVIFMNGCMHDMRCEVASNEKISDKHNHYQLLVDRISSCQNLTPARPESCFSN